MAKHPGGKVGGFVGKTRYKISIRISSIRQNTSTLCCYCQSALRSAWLHETGGAVFFGADPKRIDRDPPMEGALSLYDAGVGSSK